MTGDRLAQAGRAAALLATVATLLATSLKYQYRLELEASTTCGPATWVELQGRRAGRDEFWFVFGGTTAGLPEQAHQVDDGPPAEVAFVLSGPVTLPKTRPSVRLHRVCKLSAPGAGGVRTITCDGGVPAAACSGTLTARPDAAP